MTIIYLSDYHLFCVNKTVTYPRVNEYRSKEKHCFMDLSYLSNISLYY